MPPSVQTVEALARHFYLTTALVEEAAHLFDVYAGDGDAVPASGAVQPLLRVPGLQRLLVKMGTPLSQQDVVELLNFFGSAAATPIADDGDPSVSPTSVHAGSVAGGSSPSPTSAAQQSSATAKQGRRRSGAATHKTAGPAGADASTSASPKAAAAEKGVEDGAVVDPSAPAGPAPQTAVSSEGMNFPAFLYFIMVLPELVQRMASAHTASSTPGAAAASGHLVSISELFAAIDADGDGAWSAQDLRYAAEVCVAEDGGLLQDDPDLCRVAEMHPAELAAALHELDVDGDGVVTVEDVRQALYY
ncbi:EF hand/EF-hand domain containing protein [Novymonas esmeraldas]|uniref:EF hand/EF-hand domain containing protein n=1 Tax=Novymonas esmeraldas TaxID=1808958 RepID=A0AAW0EPA4_9TRYP